MRLLGRRSAEEADSETVDRIDNSTVCVRRVWPTTEDDCHNVLDTRLREDDHTALPEPRMWPCGGAAFSYCRRPAVEL